MIERPEVLTSRTYGFDVPHDDGTTDEVRVTIADMGGRPYELFLTSKRADALEWTMALTRMVSAALRGGMDPLKIAQELQQIESPASIHFHHGERFPSKVAHVGRILEDHVQGREPGRGYAVFEPEVLEQLRAAS